ncbi:MAG TPA: hypothetical protein VIK52_06400, partial [Opitutaceae bacterium]
IAPAKGRAGTFAIKFTKDEPATAVVVVDPIGTANLSLNTSFSVKVQGTKGDTYHITITATDPSGEFSTHVEDYTNN